MLISSLDSFRQLEPAYAMLLESSERPYSFPSEPRCVTFCFSPEQLSSVAELPLALVDTSPDVAAPILHEYARTNRRVEYWAPRADTTKLQQLVSGSEGQGLAVAGTRLTEDWIQLRISAATKQARNCDDWIAGLSVAVLSDNTVPNSTRSVASSMTMRSLAISRITPLAKRFKKYLPSSAVVFLYKALEKIR